MIFLGSSYTPSTPLLLGGGSSQSLAAKKIQISSAEASGEALFRRAGAGEGQGVLASWVDR